MQYYIVNKSSLKADNSVLVVLSVFVPVVYFIVRKFFNSVWLAKIMKIFQPLKHLELHGKILMGHLIF